MSRDDNILNTGITSASFAQSPTLAELKDKKKKRQDEKREKQLQLKPVYENVIQPIIEKNKARVKSIEEFAVEQMVDDKTFKSEVMARKKFYQFLVAFDQEIKIALKESKNGREL